MVKLTKKDYYSILSFTEWQRGLQIRDQAFENAGMKDPSEISGFFKKIYWGFQHIRNGDMYICLRQLVDEGLAERRVRPATAEEIAQYDQWQIPNDHWIRTAKKAEYKKLEIPEHLGQLVSV